MFSNLDKKRHNLDIENVRNFENDQTKPMN